MKIRKIIAAAAAVLFVSVLATGTAMAGQWEFTDFGSWRYVKDNGQYAANEWITDTDGKWYCFDKNGYMYSEIITPDGFYVDANGVWIPAEEGGQSVKAYDRVLTSAQFGMPTVYAKYSEDFWGLMAFNAELSYGEPAEPDYTANAYILADPNAKVTYHRTEIVGDYESFNYVTDTYVLKDWVNKRNGSIRMLNFKQDSNGVITAITDGDAG